ncbi:MAG: hypothetical protein Q7S37_03645 [bacterium]|nr:hypothetical protein [bacterium]
MPAKTPLIIVADKTTFLSSYPQYSGQLVEIPAHLEESNGKIIGNGLSNSGGILALLYDESEISNIQYGSSSSNFSYSYFSDGWQWVDSPSPGAPNIKPVVIPPPTPPPVVVTPSPSPTKTCPISAKIKDLLLYINCRLEIVGKVRKSFGTYFYIYDETGEAKVYLQASKKIKKPRLTAGLSLKVVGLVDNYKTGLRILPETSADIKVIVKTQPATPNIPTKSPTTENSPPSSIITASPPTADNIVFSDDIIPHAKASVKGVTQAVSIPQSNHAPLKVALLCAIVLLIALGSYNLGINHDTNKSQPQ